MRVRDSFIGVGLALFSSVGGVGWASERAQPLLMAEPGPIPADATRVAGSAESLRRAVPLAWQSLNSALGGAEDGNETWIDGEVARFVLGDQFARWLGPRADPVLRNLLGLRLRRQPDALQVTAYFERAFEVPVGDGRPARGEVYALRLPRSVRLELRIRDAGRDDAVEAQVRPSGRDWPQLRVNLPALPDGIRLVGAKLDLPSGRMDLIAAVGGGTVSLVGRTQLAAADPSLSLDLWETIRRNLDLVRGSRLRFLTR